MKGRVFVPTAKAEDWKQFLADPEKQWREGYSARATAEHWEKSKGLPTDIESVLEIAGFHNSQLLLAIPEWKTPLPGGRRESQTDVFALIGTAEGLIAAAIEAKVAEPFGPTVNEWMKGASAGKVERLEFLKKVLGLSGDIGSLRYQLLHRTASSLIEAQNFTASIAAMIVQSFHEAALWKEDLDAFASSIGLDVGRPGTTHSGAELLLAWSKPPPV